MFNDIEIKKNYERRGKKDGDILVKNNKTLYIFYNKKWNKIVE